MKAEINIETKSKFKAIYWGQKVLRSHSWESDTPVVVSAVYFEGNTNDHYLELNPLSSISDEDAIEVANLYYGRETKRYVEASIGIVKGYVLHRPESSQASITDFLRSRGYLVPWMGLSCEEIIEAGWAKYKG